MTYVVKLDETGQIQLPTPLQEALGISPGSLLQMAHDPASGRILLSLFHDEGEPYLEWRDGLLVIAGGSAPTMDIVDQIRWMRAERSAHIMGPPYTASDFLDPEEDE